MLTHRTLVFPVEPKDSRLTWIQQEFRLLVNKSIRMALQGDIRSRARLNRVGYAILSRDHAVYKQYIPSAFEVALATLKVYRRRLREGKSSSIPYMHRQMLKAENQSYRLDRATGRLRIPLRAREHIEIQLSVSAWHHRFLEDPEWELGSLTVVPGKILLVVRMVRPKTYQPTAAIALDTNEDSLDGVIASDGSAACVIITLGGIRQVQEVHFRRRRKLARKKANDRRVKQKLLRREGLRERHRVLQRLHRTSKAIVSLAEQRKAAVVLEDLTLHATRSHSQRMNRRLSSWPRGEIHRQIEYKAALEGVPVIKVNPAWTSKTCPVCGARRRDRVGKVFVCLMCDWEMDRQINAGLNILKTALASNEALARAVRFQPGALRHDVVIPLYDLFRRGTGAREEPSGVESSRPMGRRQNPKRT